MKKTILELRNLALNVLQKKYSLDHSELIAESLIFAQMSGRSTHGFIRLLPNRFGPMDEKPEGEISTTDIGDNIVKISGKGYPGVLLSSLATKEAINKVKKNSLALVAAVGNKSTSGYLAQYLREISDAGFVGIMLSNCAPLVSPLGGKKRLLGTNPIGFSVPVTGGESIVVDFGTSETSFGAAAVALEKGEKLFPNAALDSEGNFTDSPKKLFEGGSLLPFGGHRGFGLSLMIEMICGPILGATFSGLHAERGWGNLIIAFDPKMFGGNIHDCKEMVEHFLKDENTKDDFRLPGTNSYKNYLAIKKSGVVDIEEGIYQQILKLYF